MRNYDYEMRERQGRTWECVFYPDSAPKNWRTLLDKLQGYVVLHDKDYNQDGEIKKAHYHLILCWDEKRAFHQVNDIFKLFNASVDRQNARVKNKRSAIRYLCHLDNPEKYQYPESDVETFGGAVPYKTAILSSADVEQATQEIIDEIVDFIHTEYISTFNQLVSMGKKERDNHPEWSIYIRKYSHYFYSVIKSFCYERTPDGMKTQRRMEKAKEIEQDVDKKIDLVRGAASELVE